MSTIATGNLPPNARRHAIFVMSVLISSLAFYKTLSELVRYSLRDQSSSHIILIPLVAISLLYLERQRIFSITRTSFVSGAAWCWLE